MTQIEIFKQKFNKMVDNISASIDNGADYVIDEVYRILDSLKEKLPEGLEEAAMEYAEKHGFRVPYDGSNNFYDDVDVKASKEGFIAGAEWQKAKDQKTIELAEDHAMLAGMNKMEQQMMEKAVEGVVHPDDCEIWVNLVGYGYKFKDGDKVRVIVIKED